MNTKPNLFIVSSPLQTINAIEAIHHFNLSNNTLIIVHNFYNDKNSQQMSAIAHYYDWRKIIVIGKNKPRSKFFQYLSLIKKLRRTTYNYVFFAGPSSGMDAIIANIKKNKTYILDDGVATIAIHKAIKNNEIKKIRAKFIRFWLFGLKTQVRDKINLFTYFDLKPLPNIEVVRNNLGYFKQKYIDNFEADNNIYFLGHPHDEHTNAYADILDKFIPTHKHKIIYAPHRSEVINEPLRKVLNKYNVKVKQFGMPVEMYFITHKILPYMVAGFNTTAFFTLKFLYPDAKYQSIYSANKNNPEHKVSEEVYKHIYNTGVEKLNFPLTLNDAISVNHPNLNMENNN